MKAAAEVWATRNLSNTTLTDGSAVTPDHREVTKSGQQKDYVVLSEEERKKGFVRPVRLTYTHNKCGGDTSMKLSIAETYASEPEFYSKTFCVSCGAHFPVDEFVWKGSKDVLGS